MLFELLGPSDEFEALRNMPPQPSIVSAPAAENDDGYLSPDADLNPDVKPSPRSAAHGTGGAQQARRFATELFDANQQLEFEAEQLSRLAASATADLTLDVRALLLRRRDSVRRERDFLARRLAALGQNMRAAYPHPPSACPSLTPSAAAAAPESGGCCWSPPDPEKARAVRQTQSRWLENAVNLVAPSPPSRPPMRTRAPSLPSLLSNVYAPAACCVPPAAAADGSQPPHPTPPPRPRRLRQLALNAALSSSRCSPPAATPPGYAPGAASPTQAPGATSEPAATSRGPSPVDMATKLW